MSPDSFLVTVRPDDIARFYPSCREAAEAWTLHDVYLASGYAAAVTYEDRARSLAVVSIDDPGEFAIRSRTLGAPTTSRQIVRP